MSEDNSEEFLEGDPTPLLVNFFSQVLDRLKRIETNQQEDRVLLQNLSERVNNIEKNNEYKNIHNSEIESIKKQIDILSQSSDSQKELIDASVKALSEQNGLL